MTLQTPIHPADKTVARVATHQGLAGFLHPACAAAIWHRPTPQHIQDDLDSLTPQHLPNGRVVAHRSQIDTAVRKMCDIAGTPHGAARDHLIADIVALSDTFADLMGVDHLRLRLNAVTTNACRKFHVDAITARLVCTYRGPGTQYGFAAPGSDPDHILTVPTGAPILLRGSLAPEHPASGLLHRSPPIEGSGATRLVLVLDPVTNPEDT